VSGGGISGAGILDGGTDKAIDLFFLPRTFILVA